MVMMLSIDRAVSCARIFDENAVQGCILAAWGINFLRTTVAPQSLSDKLNPVATFLWVCFACCLALEPRRVQEFFVMYGHGSGGVFKRVLPGIVTGLFVVVMVFIPFKGEHLLITAARSIGFACLCVAWVYMVSVWRPKPRHNGSCVFECHLLLSRFCPILYVDQGVAIFYACVCVVILAYHYVQIHVMVLNPLSMVPEVQAVQSVVGDCTGLSEVANLANLATPKIPPSSPAPSKPCSSISSTILSSTILSSAMLSSITEMNVEEDDEDLEAYFRTACQSRQQ